MILPDENQPKIEMAAIRPIFEVGTRKLVYNPKLIMLLGVYGKKYQKPLLRPKKLGRTNVPPPVQVSWLTCQHMEG